MKNKGLFIFVCLFIYINCYCKGNHNRIDLNKKECARYEIEREEISDNVEDYECCYTSMINDYLFNGCWPVPKDKKQRAIMEGLEYSPLNVIDASFECSIKYLSFYITKIKILLALFLF